MGHLEFSEAKLFEATLYSMSQLDKMSASGEGPSNRSPHPFRKMEMASACRLK